MQLAAILAVLVLLGVAAVVFLRNGDDGGGDGGGVEVAVEESRPVSAELELELGGVTNEVTGTPSTFAPEQADQIMELVVTYVDEGLIAPLKSGEGPGDEILGLFDAGAAARLVAGDRALLFEEGMPKLDGDLEATASPVLITTLADPTGAIQLVTAGFTYEAAAPTAEGRFTITRTTELTFVPDGAGSWTITGYDVSLGRAPAAATTTTAPAS